MSARTTARFSLHLPVGLREDTITLYLIAVINMPKSAQLFITCIVDTIYPEIGESVMRVLARAGVQVEFPGEQTCCGQPAFNAGMRAEARKMAQHTLRVLEKSAAPIVVPSGSCAAMIKHGYPELFQEQPDWLARANNIAGRVFEFSEYLVDRLGITFTNTSYTGRISYHASCHLLRELGIDRQPRGLLESINPSEFVELTGADECCGFGGLFSVEHPQISAAMLQRKIDNILAAKADVVACCDAGCMSNINGGLHRQGHEPKVLHIAQILDEPLSSEHVE